MDPEPASSNGGGRGKVRSTLRALRWPAYSYVAPMSWLVRRDVDDGRDELNFSEWDRDAGEADDAIDAIRDGSMPPNQYTLLHRSARLTAEEAAQLIAALERMDDERDGGNSGPG